MHDIDHTQLESEFGFESEEFGYEDESEVFGESGESPFSEAEEMEYAAELLGITTEAELDQFLGSLIRRAGRAVGSFVKSPIGRAIGGALKGVAKTALPIAGKAIGTYFGGPAGGAIGGKLAGTAGKIFGLELEGLSQEDQEFEVARRFVRLAGSAARNAALAPAGTPPHVAAQQALAAAAQQHAPGLVGAGVGAAGGRRKQSGRWIRRGRVIMVLGA
jgi:hypothetical protein